MERITLPRALGLGALFVWFADVAFHNYIAYAHPGALSAALTDALFAALAAVAGAMFIAGMVLDRKRS